MTRKKKNMKNKSQFHSLGNTNKKPEKNKQVMFQSPPTPVTLAPGLTTCMAKSRPDLSGVDQPGSWNRTVGDMWSLYITKKGK